MPSLQEIPAFFPLPLVLLIGMGVQVLGLRLRSRSLIVCGALASVLAALAERDMTFLVAQALLLWLYRQRKFL
ncbi:MAG TPA: hypothetical protein H9857_06705 [Candidatus Desulfovibrio intestinigallinarum]|nr:hypothetical protein [Candidatus Desulfovibrio intestinigallinarum]